jgi:class 3 adenylate cyclase
MSSPNTSGIAISVEHTAAATDGERKTVTALFADIKGSMELTEDLDPEEVRAIIDPALTIMVDAVGRHDGYIVQSTGDGIRRYGDRMRAQGRMPLQVRVEHLGLVITVESTGEEKWDPKAAMRILLSE